jgi:hypothetical protein
VQSKEGEEDLREEKGRGKRRGGKGAKKWRQGRAERGLCRRIGRKKGCKCHPR